MVNKLKSRIPYLGNNQALKNHIANALRNAGDLSVVIRNIDAIPKENMDSLTKTGLEKFKNEIIPEIRQIIKETQGETAEQGSKLEQAGAKQVVEKQGSGASIGGLTANSNAHLGSGMVAGTLNSVDEDGNFSPERFAAGFLAGLVGSKAAAVGLRKMTPKLYNQILGAAEKMPQMANGNPRLLGKLYSNGKDVSLNSFAGEKAITANVGKLDQAKAMLEKGADEVEIWQKTGWFKDKDGAWKFEIGDSNAKLNPNFQSGGRLDKLLEHEELFKAYPELKDVRVVKIGDETPSGAALSVKDAAQREKRGIYNVAFNNKKSTIIRKDLDAIDEIIKFEKGEADYMLHGERKSGYGALHIQKHLDTQNNGWVTKQEYLDMGQMLRKSMMEEADDKRIYTYFNDEGIRFRVVIGIGKNKERVISFYSNRKPLKAGLSYNSQNYDGNLPLNEDIIAQNGTKGYYSPAKNEIGLRDIGDKSTLMHEVQHAIQEIEDFARGGDFNTVWNVAAKNIEKKYESELVRLEKISNDAWGKHAPLQKEYIKLFDDGLKDAPEAQRLLKQMRAFGDEGSRADHEIRELRQAVNAEQNAITEEDLQEIYRKIHGEAEARNVQNRLNLDRKAHPHETFDVNPNETIVSKEDGISYSRKIEEQRFAGTGRDKTTIMYATPHVGTGLAGGTLNAKDENGNFDAEKFAKGFIYGLFGSKITAATLKKTNPKLYDQIVKIAEGNASKEKISSFVNKLKQDELGKLLQKTVTNKDLSTKTKVEIIEAAKSRYAQEIK
ncbi:LPD23 domain-containing protein [Campylobacter showae]